MCLVVSLLFWALKVSALNKMLSLAFRVSGNNKNNVSSFGFFVQAPIENM